LEEREKGRIFAPTKQKKGQKKKKDMKTFSNTLKAFAAVLFALVISNSFCSCSNDNDVVEVQREEVTNQTLSGYWFAKGMVKITTDYGKECTGMLQSLYFDVDGTGYRMTVALDSEDQYVGGEGGKQEGHFSYVITKDNVVDIRMDVEGSTKEPLLLTYSKGRLMNLEKSNASAMKHADLNMEKDLKAYANYIENHIYCDL